MNDLVFAGNKALYLILTLSAIPVAVATAVGLIIGLIQTVTQLQEQTLPFGIKLLSVSLCLFLLAGWYGDTLLAYAREVIGIALRRP
ncbi:EscS/YscS/HrcS family type III secretion system export apparatus protein [Candidatus Williamhamiltonella defendens]|uniref:Surface presentation of antigens protein SpaQ n=3 Tax=Candidatus Williamhamiltonella defendens TaxID=138072 RepID=A0A249DZW3_9ENTR|nr:EscS/YscS/HrcS family type III secretion system export apparatus protein [Candidatus Hamiltonella defensa]ABA29438.1 putative type III secretion system protein [Candidatus Hamiltonella defensa]ACQ68131.1 type III needle complex export protein [Candidatus Hamiltonella defensa 5AT (Acyrthosiphon pisum)]ASV33287.1 EscS/YscS/HrcS family type III secretion system export apparatus protein [Candidatus Hamiltonella defensa]ASX26879.1 EscS/YscS/HrcS family type III secretion system export apparatus p